MGPPPLPKHKHKHSYRHHSRKKDHEKKASLTEDPSHPFYSDTITTTRSSGVDDQADVAMDVDVTTADDDVDVANDTATSSSSLNVFYNIYIPADQGDDAIRKAVDIVREQMGQVVSAVNTTTMQTTTTVHYNTVGSTAVNATWMDSLCSGSGNSSSHNNSTVTCRHMQHYETAHEEQTLQRLYDFCQAHPDDTVAYIHTKGSFHNTAWNGLPQDTWRRHGTAAAMSQECLTHVAKEDGQCNVCGLLFTIWPFVHTPGNFFSAQCSYISQLLPPMQFEEKMEDLHDERLQLKEKGNLVMGLFNEENNTVGRGRYAAEHWVGSSPDIRPCDLSNTWDIKFWQRRNRPATAFNFSVVPRHRANLHNKRVRTQDHYRMREYFLLPGLLFKHLTLYGTVPPEGSWMWSWFPDGEKWKSAFEEYGNKVVETVTETYTHTREESDHKGVISRGSKKADALQAVARELVVPAQASTMLDAESSSPPFAIFYNIYIPADKGLKSVNKALQVVEEQLDQVASSYVTSLENKSATVYYNTIGMELAHIEIDRICSEKDKVTCRHLQHFAQGQEDVTLQNVYDYCQTHESERVVYIHSKGTFHSTPNQANWRRSMTEAVTSEMCLNPPDDACTVCGMILLPFPALHMPGNFFTADCSYVKKLIPPINYGQRMENVTMQMLLRKLQNRFVADLLPDDPWHYGIDRWSSEHWIGSHPDVRPCDLSKEPRLEHWRDTPRKATEFSWAMAPRHNASARWSYVWPAQQIPKREDIRMRESYLLAGNLFKWSMLYNAAPGPSSWIWDWYPDGETWKESVNKYGAKAVDVMTEKFAAKQ